MATNDTEPRFESGGSYVEGSRFVGILGSNGRAKVLAALLGKRDTDLSVSELEDLTGLDNTWARKQVEDLTEYGIVQQTRRVGQTKMYQLNPESPVARALYDLYEATLQSRSED